MNVLSKGSPPCAVADAAMAGVRLSVSSQALRRLATLSMFSADDGVTVDKKSKVRLQALRQPYAVRWLPTSPGVRKDSILWRTITFIEHVFLQIKSSVLLLLGVPRRKIHDEQCDHYTRAIFKVKAAAA
jgi:hypothetical protein